MIHSYCLKNTMQLMFNERFETIEYLLFDCTLFNVRGNEKWMDMDRKALMRNLFVLLTIHRNQICRYLFSPHLRCIRFQIWTERANL